MIRIRLYCGFQDAIEIFDVQRPGEGERLYTTPSKKSKDGLKGVCSVHITNFPRRDFPSIMNVGPDFPFLILLL